MRFYGYNNMYLTGLHPGIQSLHGLGRMVLATQGTPAWDTFVTWLDKHETAILLKGPDHEGLQEVFAAWQRLRQEQEALPLSHFLEPGLNHSWTCVGVVLDEAVYLTEAEALSPIEHKEIRALSPMGRLDLGESRGWSWNKRAAALLQGYPLAS